MKTNTLEQTPVIHSRDITTTKYLGEVEIAEDIFSFLRITAHGVDYLIAGGVCNTGLIAEYAREIESHETTDEALSDMISDIETMPYPSGALLSWHGSLVI
jgi:hypothetical protein